MHAAAPEPAQGRGTENAQRSQNQCLARPRCAHAQPSWHRSDTVIDHELSTTAIPRRGRRGVRALPAGRPRTGVDVLQRQHGPLPRDRREHERTVRLVPLGDGSRPQRARTRTSTGRSRSRSTSSPGPLRSTTARAGSTPVQATGCTCPRVACTVSGTSPVNLRPCCCTSHPALRARTTSKDCRYRRR